MSQKEHNKMKLNKKLNLKNDIIFKTFFSRKGNEEFLIDFLESLLKIEIQKIWLAFIDDYNEEMIKVAEEKNKTLKKARLEMNYLTGDEAIQRLEELREKWEMDWISGINNARQEGKNKGKIEEKIEIAKQMIKKNMAIELIEEITKLPKEEIEKIKQENKL